MEAVRDSRPYFEYTTLRSTPRVSSSSWSLLFARFVTVSFISTPQFPIHNATLYIRAFSSNEHAFLSFVRRRQRQGALTADDTMFIKKDTRKIPDILADESDEREELHLGRRCALEMCSKDAIFQHF